MTTDCVHQLFASRAALTPDAVAVRCEDVALSYAALDRVSSAYAEELSACRLPPNAIVGVYCQRSVEMLIAVLAVLKAGHAYLPLDPSYPEDRLRFMLEDSGAGAILTTRACVGKVPSASTVTIVVDANDRTEKRPGEAATAPAPPGTEDRCYVIYTSGSTGTPKGVEVLHGSLTNFILDMGRAFDTSPRDVILALTTLSFDIAALELFLPLVVGATVVIATEAEGRDGVRMRRLIADHGVTLVQSTPSRWQLLIDAGLGRSDGIRNALCGGEAMAVDLGRRLATRVGTLWNMYGPTETTVWSAMHRIEPSVTRISIGRPIAETQIYIVDALGHALGKGQTGEICIGGRGLARGYLNREALTSERFVVLPLIGPDRVYRTGDLGSWGEDDNLYFEGRADTQTKFRGYRIELGEIEAVLRAHPAVTDSAVVVRDGSEGIPNLVAYVSTRVPPPSDAWPADQDELAMSLPCRLRRSASVEDWNAGELIAASPRGLRVDAIAPAWSIGDALELWFSDAPEHALNSVAATVERVEPASVIVALDTQSNTLDSLLALANSATFRDLRDQSYRLPINLPVLLKREDGSESRAYTLNVGPRGVGLTGVVWDLEPRETVSLTIVVPDGVNARLDARVAWCSLGSAGVELTETAATTDLFRRLEEVARIGRPDLNTLRTLLRAKLPDYMIPTHFVLLSRLPLTPNGKVDRKNLPPPAADQPAPVAAPSAATEALPDLEAALTEIWKAVLAVPNVTPSDDFSGLGGNSLAMARIVARVRKNLGVEDGLAGLVGARTVREMAAVLKDAAGPPLARAPSENPVQVEGASTRAAWRTTLGAFCRVTALFLVGALVIYVALARGVVTQRRKADRRFQRRSLILATLAHGKLSPTVVILGSSPLMPFSPEDFDRGCAARGVDTVTENLAVVGVGARGISLVARTLRSRLERDHHRTRLAVVSWVLQHDHRPAAPEWVADFETALRFEAAAGDPLDFWKTSRSEAWIIPFAVGANGLAPSAVGLSLRDETIPASWQTKMISGRADTTSTDSLLTRYVNVRGKMTRTRPPIPLVRGGPAANAAATEDEEWAVWREWVGEWNDQARLERAVLAEATRDFNYEHPVIEDRFGDVLEAVANLRAVSNHVAVVLLPTHPAARHAPEWNARYEGAAHRLVDRHVDVINGAEWTEFAESDFIDFDHFTARGHVKLRERLAAHVAETLSHDAR